MTKVDVSHTCKLAFSNAFLVAIVGFLLDDPWNVLSGRFQINSL